MSDQRTFTTPRGTGTVFRSGLQLWLRWLPAEGQSSHQLKIHEKKSPGSASGIAYAAYMPMNGHNVTINVPARCVWGLYNDEEV